MLVVSHGYLMANNMVVICQEMDLTDGETVEDSV